MPRAFLVKSTTRPYVRPWADDNDDVIDNNNNNNTDVTTNTTTDSRIPLPVVDDTVHDGDDVDVMTSSPRRDAMPEVAGHVTMTPSRVWRSRRPLEAMTTNVKVETTIDDFRFGSRVATPSGIGESIEPLR